MLSISCITFWYGDQTSQTSDGICTQSLTHRAKVKGHMTFSSNAMPCKSVHNQADYSEHDETQRTKSVHIDQTFRMCLQAHTHTQFRAVVVCEWWSECVRAPLRLTAEITHTYNSEWLRERDACVFVAADVQTSERRCSGNWTGWMCVCFYHL